MQDVKQLIKDLEELKKELEDTNDPQRLEELASKLQEHAQMINDMIEIK